MQWFNNIKIGTKLISGFIMVALIATIIGLVGIIQMKKMDDNGAKMYEKVTVPISDLADISTAFQRVRINLRELVDTNDKQEKTQIIETIKKLRADISEKSVAFEKTILTDDGRKLFEDFKKSRDGYALIVDKVTQLAELDKDAEATAVLKTDGKKAAFFEQEMLDKLQEAKIKQGKLTDEDNDKTAKNARNLMISLVAIGVVLAIGLGLFITRTITRPINEAVAVANSLAKGDLTITVESKSKDETGLMMSAISLMVEKLKNVVGDVMAAADNVSSGSQELSATAQQMSQGATEQAASAEEISSSMEEMASSCRHERDRYQDQHHRRDRPPDQPVGTERRHRGCPCRRAWQRFCRGCF